MFETRFNFKEIEPEIYRLWEEAGAFKANENSSKPPFAVVIPPPNITGSLHIGHALNNTLQDLLTRYKRMSGFEALYLPGTDHAGIATQFVVEKELAKEKLTRFDLGRDKFVERTLFHKDKYEATIVSQLKRLGCSCDWTRLRFTMDQSYSHAVRVAFVSLYNKGLIYRGEYIVNWCPRCLTALSDLELERKEEKGGLWFIKYPHLDGGGHVVVATTRPETMLGDVAVAVNPKDERYMQLVGKKVRLPLVNRGLEIIADNFVDPSFGTGAVKITPAHDPYDFECSQRHNLQRICVMDEKGIINTNGGQFAGMDRFAARKKIIEELITQNLLERTEEYTVTLSRCHRCSTVTEPYLSLQWFVKMEPLAKASARAVESGDVKFFPDRFKKVYLDWLSNIKDWCISRQIWWGHRLPVWHCKSCQAQAASIEKLNACEKCKSTDLVQETDVLDTWFSSALWPFATLGWPAATQSLERFYPTSTLVTGRDIINLWVSRMVTTGLEFLHEKPFSDVVINPMIQTLEGKRMSKSLGTGVDPLEIMDQYGADALRFGLVIQVTQSQDIRFSPDKIETARNFITKVWNAARFVFTNSTNYSEELPSILSLEDRWIVSRLQTVIEEYTKLLDLYEFGAAARLLYHFVWDEYCDWYIELSKRDLKSETTQQTLRHMLFTILKLLHPLIPFATEAIWQRFGKKVLATLAWPRPDEKKRDRELEDNLALCFEAIRAVRDIRNKMNIPSITRLSVVIDATEAAHFKFDKFKPIIIFLAKLDRVEFRKGKPRASASYVSSGFQMYVPLEGKIDIKAEIKRQESRKSDLLDKLDAVERKFSNKDFIRRAPPEVVKEEEERLEEIKRQLKEIESAIRDLSSHSV